MTEQNNFLLKNIRYIMSVGSSSTQTYDIVTQDFIPEASSINVGSKNINKVINLINNGESKSKFKDEGKILCVNSIGYNEKLFPPNSEGKGVCNLDGTDIKNITDILEINNMNESIKDRVFVLNRNCKNVFVRKDYNEDGGELKNKDISELSGQWASVEKIAEKLWKDCVDKDTLIENYNFDKLPTIALQLPPTSNYAICDIGGGSTTVYTLNNNKLEKDKTLTNNVKNNVERNLGKNVKKDKVNGFNDIMNDSEKIKSYYKSVIDGFMNNDLNRAVIMIQTGKQREAFFNTDEQLQTYIKEYMPENVNNVHFMFLPHELEGKYEAIDFCDTIAPNKKLINLKLIKSGEDKKIEISDSIVETIKKILNIKGGSKTKKMKKKSKKNSKRKTRKNPIKRLLKKLKKKTKNKRSKKKKTSKK